MELESSLEYNYITRSYPGYLARDFASKDLELFLSDLKDYKPSICVLCLGANDLGHGLLPDEVVLSLLALIEKVSNIRVIAMYLHSKYEVFNDLYGEKAPDEVAFCPFLNVNINPKLHFQSDGYHLNEIGKQALADELQDMIESEDD